MKIKIDKNKLIEKFIQINGIIVHLVGIAKIEDHFELVTIHYDETFDPQNHHSHFNGRTNRSLMKREGVKELRNPIEHIHMVIIGQTEFTVKQSQTSFIGSHDENCMKILDAFKTHGWKHTNLDVDNLDKMAMSRYRLEGSISELVINQDDIIRFTKRPTSVSYLVERPMRLHIGDDYPEKMTFTSKETHESHWVQIHRVHLIDVRAEMAGAFDNPVIKKQMTPDQIEKARLDFEKEFSNVCPKGMLLPVVEYECEEDISLQFYTTDFLDSIPPKNSSGMGFIVGADQPKGKHGYKLKATIIQEPVSADTEYIDAELFKYSVMIKESEIVI